MAGGHHPDLRDDAVRLGSVKWQSPERQPKGMFTGSSVRFPAYSAWGGPYLSLRSRRLQRSPMKSAELCAIECGTFRSEVRMFLAESAALSTLEIGGRPPKVAVRLTETVNDWSPTRCTIQKTSQGKHAEKCGTTCGTERQADCRNAVGKGRKDGGEPRRHGKFISCWSAPCPRHDRVCRGRRAGQR